MINWAKFQAPFSAESAALSDYVYPLNQSIVTKIEAIDHTGALMSSDMLHNADDRRFALSQSSPSRRAYDFKSNKLGQMETAVDTLTTYIQRREAYYNSPVTQPISTYELQQDLTGMPSDPVPEDQISECCLSPSPQPTQSLPPVTTSSSRPESARRMAGTPSTATASTAPTTHASELSYQPTSTAPTNVSLGLSIADLIHPPLTLPSPPPRFSLPMTPDLEMDSDSHTYHFPDPAFLQATLASIRSSRGISEPRYGSSTRNSNGPPPAVEMRRGRSLKIPRMRRSSQSRKAAGDGPASSGQVRATPSSTAEHTGKSRLLQPASRPSRSADYEGPPPFIEPETPPQPSTGKAPHIARCATTTLDEWWNAQRQRHTCEDCAELDSPTSTNRSPLLSPWRTAAPGLDPGHTQWSTHVSQPQLDAALPLTVEVDKNYEVPRPSDDRLYAYPRGRNPVRPSPPRAAKYSYGYIAGDVPGAREGKVRVRSTPKGRVRGRSGDDKTDARPSADRVVSGVKRRRDGILSEGPGSGSNKQRAVDPPVKLEQPDSDFDEEDLELLREARRRAERWWKEPLVSVSSVQEAVRRPP